MIKIFKKNLNKNTELFINKKYKHIVTCSLIHLFTLSLILGIQPQADAQVVSSATIKSEIAKQLQATYSKMTNADVDVKIIATPFSELVLPDGKITYKITQGGDKVISRDIKRVDIYVNKAFVKSLNLPTQTCVYKEVLVAADNIDREQAITREATILKKIDISQKVNYILTDKALNKEMSARKSFMKGEVIDKRFVKMKPDVERNMGVRIFFVSNGAVMITIDGTALADGMTGDYVNVENKNYKRTYTGKVIGENRVLVNI